MFHLAHIPVAVVRRSFPGDLQVQARVYRLHDTGAFSTFVRDPRDFLRVDAPSSRVYVDVVYVCIRKRSNIGLAVIQKRIYTRI